MEEKRAPKERLAGVLLFVLVGFAAVSAAINGLSGTAGLEPANPNPGPLSSGAVAPAFELESLEGDTISLAQFRGRPALLMFWDTSSGPCSREFLALDKVAEKFSDDKLAVLTINSDFSKGTIYRALDKVDTSLPVLHDVEWEVSHAYRAHAIPTFYLIDQQGKVYTVWTGAVDDLEVQLTENIGFVVENHKASPPAEAG